MIFTVIQYLPVLEEETPTHRVEMTKKAKADTMPDDDDNGDDDNNDDEKTDLLYCHQSASYHAGLEFERRFYTKHKIYRYPIANITTPPPRS